jgi:hypothetical protein
MYEGSAVDHVRPDNVMPLHTPRVRVESLCDYAVTLAQVKRHTETRL